VKRSSGERALAGALTLLGITMLAVLVSSNFLTIVQEYILTLYPDMTENAEILLDCAAYILSIALPLVLFTTLRGGLCPVSGPRRRTSDNALSFGLICMGAGLLSSVVSSLISAAIEENGTVLYTFLPSFEQESMLGVFLKFVSLSILPAVMEELLFRRAMINVLRPYGNFYAVAVSSLCFTLCHTTVGQLLPAAVMGMCLGWTFLYTGKLSLCIGIHFIYNLYAAFITLLGEKYSPSFSGTALIISTVIFVLLGTAAAVRLLRCDDDEEYEPEHYPRIKTGNRLLAIFSNIPFLTAAAVFIWFTVSQSAL